VILHNIRSLHNVGSVLRTADGAGAKKIYMTGYTPQPCDELGRVRPEIKKTALGAESAVSWEAVKNPRSLIARLKKEGFAIVALEKTPAAADYRTYIPAKKIVLVVGNEVRGISPALLSKVDSIISLPMRGKKESLNVSVACGVALYYLTGSPT